MTKGSQEGLRYHSKTKTGKANWGTECTGEALPVDSPKGSGLTTVL